MVCHLVRDVLTHHNAGLEKQWQGCKTHTTCIKLVIKLVGRHVKLVKLVMRK